MLLLLDRWGDHEEFSFILNGFAPQATNGRVNWHMTFQI